MEGVPTKGPASFSPVRSDRKWRDRGPYYHRVVLILSLSRMIELISLFSFLTMSILAPYCVSEEEAGEPGDSCWGVGGESRVVSAREGSIYGRTMGRPEGDFSVLLVTT